VPAKKSQISDAERAKRIREAARELETSNDPDDFDMAFDRVAKVKKPNEPPKTVRATWNPPPKPKN